MNRAALTRVADAIEDGAGRPFTMATVWTGGDPGCSSPGCIAGWTVETLAPPETLPRYTSWPGSTVDRAAEILGLTDYGQVNALMRPTLDVTGYDYRRESGDLHITRAHAVAALRDLAAGGPCDETLWKRTAPGDG